MKHKILVATLILTIGTAHAQWNFDNSPSRVFDMSKNITPESKIRVEYVDNSEIGRRCDQQSRAYGFGGYPVYPLACTWYWKDRCHVIVPKNVDMRTFGHELLHCYQGSWHQEP